MTWEELVEKAKELGYELNNDTVHDYLKKDDVMFYSNGSISAIYMECAWHSDICCFSTDRTPSQMYQIMLALED